MQTLAEIRSLLESRGLAPKKSLGQNFLIDQNLIRSLVEASGVGLGDLVLEIGPGTGTLTEELLARGCRVVACELDEGLAQLLAERFSDVPGKDFTLIVGDCLEGKKQLNTEVEATLGAADFRLVANLPYGAASPLMVLLARDPRCLGQYVTVQREVAERVRARAGTRDYSELSVMVQCRAKVQKLATLPPACFWPRPKVTSEMIAIEPLPANERIEGDRYEHLATLCRTLFTQRRKQIGSVLGRSHPYPEEIDPSSRPEQLSVEELTHLSDWFRNCRDESSHESDAAR